MNVFKRTVEVSYHLEITSDEFEKILAELDTTPHVNKLATPYLFQLRARMIATG